MTEPATMRVVFMCGGDPFGSKDMTRLPEVGDAVELTKAAGAKVRNSDRGTWLVDVEATETQPGEWWVAASWPRVANVPTTRQLDGLQLGFHGARVDFDHRPYDDRTAPARAAYDRLRDSIEVSGIRQPILVHGPHVLAGMRRVEIARAIGWDGQRPLEALDITEDVATWTAHDVTRFVAWKANLYPDVADFMP